MFERAYRALGSFIWRTAIALLVLIAVVVSLATALVPLLPAVKTSLVAEIESRTGFDAQVVGITAEMEGFRPKLALEDLNIRNRKPRLVYSVRGVFKSRSTPGVRCCSVS